MPQLACDSPNPPGPPQSCDDADRRNGGSARRAVVPARRLRRNRERYRPLIGSGALFLRPADLSGRITGVDGRERLTGPPESEAPGRGRLQRLDPDDGRLPDFGGRPKDHSVTADFRVLDRNGQWRRARGRGQPLAAADGYPGERVGVVEDIHDEGPAMERLR